MHGLRKSQGSSLAKLTSDPASAPVGHGDPAEIRRRIALVPQEGVLFSASARDNLRYGRWDATEDQIWQAATAANAADFLRAIAM